jgi:hypothetical protein
MDKGEKKMHRLSTKNKRKKSVDDIPPPSHPQIYSTAPQPMNQIDYANTVSPVFAQLDEEQENQDYG